MHLDLSLNTNEISLRQILIYTSPPYTSPRTVNLAWYMYHAQIPQLLRAGKKVDFFSLGKKSGTLFHSFSFFSRSWIWETGKNGEIVTPHFNG